MGQYDDKVERQRLLLLAEEWAEGVAGVHIHSMSSMWYDTRPQDTQDGTSVIDTQYNNGLIERTLNDGTVVYFGEQLKGDALIEDYVRKVQPTMSQKILR